MKWLSDRELLRLAVWLWQTQRNGRGPRRYLGMPLIEWALWLVLIAGVLMGGWLVFVMWR